MPVWKLQPCFCASLSRANAYLATFLSCQRNPTRQVNAVILSYFIILFLLPFHLQRSHSWQRQWSPSNEAMILLLTPLLPVARMLKVPVLDFDTYLDLQDSKDLGKLLLPKIQEFLCIHASKSGEKTVQMAGRDVLLFWFKQNVLSTSSHVMLEGIPETTKWLTEDVR